MRKMRTGRKGRKIRGGRKIKRIRKIKRERRRRVALIARTMTTPLILLKERT